MAGANVKIGANSSEFQRQMKEVVNQLKVTQSQFSLASEKAKLFGNSTDQLKAKQGELANKLKAQNTIVAMSREAIRQINKEIIGYKNANEQLSKKIADTEKKQKEAVETYGKGSKEVKELDNNIKELKEQYAKNEKAIESSNKKIDNQKIKLNESEKAMMRTKKAMEENKKALEDVNKELDNAKLEKFKNNLSKVEGKLDSFGNSLSLKVTAPIIGVGVAGFNMASDLNENINKTDVVFKDNATIVENWSKTALDKMGMCQSSALEMASKFGDMGSSMGLSSKQTMNYSMGLTQLSADLASFKNISIDRANEALTGVYTGETEALKGLGIVMTQTNLQQFAQSQGIKKKIQDMTQAEQVQLRYNYVMSKTKDAQGDFARTGDQAANAGRTFKEAMKELGASFGNDLLPQFTPIINNANKLIKSFANMGDGTRSLILHVGTIAALAGPIAKVTSGILKLTSGTISGVKKIKDFAKATKEGTSWLSKFSKGITNCTKNVVSFGKKIGSVGWSGITKGAKGAAKGIANLGKGFANAAIATGKFTLSLIKMIVQLTISGAKIAFNTAKLILQKVAMAASTVATKLMVGAQAALNLAMSLNPIVLIIGLLVSLGATFVILYNKCEWFRNGVKTVWNGIKSVFKGFSDFLGNVFSTDWTTKLGLLGVPLNSFFETVKAIFNGVKGIFNGLITFFKGVFTGNWREAFQGLSDIVSNIFGMIGGVIKAPINAAISGINWVISKINGIGFDVPSWVPGIGGSHFGIDLPQIPMLENGGIVTKATLAMVGEGKEHEAVMPLSKLDRLVTNSVRKVLNGRGNDKNIFVIVENKTELDGEVIGSKTYKKIARKLKGEEKSYKFTQGKRGAFTIV